MKTGPELATKRFSKLDSDNADLLAGYQAIGTEKEFTPCNAGWVRSRVVSRRRVWPCAGE